MQTVTIQISDADYNDMIEHLAKERLGRINVAVVKLINVDGFDTQVDSCFLNAELAAIEGEQEEARKLASWSRPNQQPLPEPLTLD